MKAKCDRDGRLRLLDMHAHPACFMGNNGEQSAVENGGVRCIAKEGQARRGAENGAVWRCAENSEARYTSIDAELVFRRDAGVATFFSCGTPDEWTLMQTYRQREEVHLSFGIHPWYADKYEETHIGIAEAYRLCDAVGEIGMDNVWCSVPLDVQRRVFARQLQIAADLRKPIVLHTKGMEAEIAAMVRGFPHPVCVHWYSGDTKTFEKFLEQDCYFTLGPDLAAVCGARAGGTAMEADKERTSGAVVEADKERAGSELYRLMLREIPANRLFTETDGVSAVAWAMGRERAEISEIPGVLAANLECIAREKNMRGDELRGRIWANLEEFICGTRSGETPSAAGGREEV